MKGDGHMNKLVNLMFLLVILYAAATFAASCAGRVIPDALTYSFFSFMAADGGAMAWIKVRKGK